MPVQMSSLSAVHPVLLGDSVSSVRVADALAHPSNKANAHYFEGPPGPPTSRDSSSWTGERAMKGFEETARVWVVQTLEPSTSFHESPTPSPRHRSLDRWCSAVTECAAPQGGSHSER